MSKQKEFHVIELLEPSYIDPEKYVCIPNSWIRLRETSDGPALVEFPVEELSEIKKRVEKQEFSENGTVFMANIKYSTNSYKDANNYIKILNKIFDQEQSSTKIVEDVPSTSHKKVLESQSSSETNKVCTTSTLNSDVEPVSKEIPKQLDVTNTEVRMGRKKSKVETADSSPKARRYLTRQSHRISLSDNNTVNLPDQTTEENFPKTSHCVEESDTTNNNQENKPLAKNPSELMSPKWQIIMALRSVFGDNFKQTLEQLHSNFDKNQLVLEKMRLAFMEHCKIIKELIELTNEVNNGPDISDIDSAVKELENSMMEVNMNENDSDKAYGSKVQNDSQNKEEEKHNSDGTEVKNNNPLIKIRGQARKFTLPPEYDPNDSKWTLKHQEKKSGLVELLPLSRVYIDAFQLSNIKITSKDSKTLARRLLQEIFTENALSICSLTGKKANAFDLEGTSVRPGLDEHARTVLFNYVKKHAAEQNWVEFDSQLMKNTIRNKMQEIRGKHQNTVEK